MRRTIFGVVAGISLVLFLAVVFARIKIPTNPRSHGMKFYTATHEFILGGGDHEFYIEINGGVRTPTGIRALPGKMWNGRWATTNHRLPTGIAYGHSPADDPKAAFYFGLLVPWWELLTVPAILPLLWITLRLLRSTPKVASQCAVCDYDLTGNASGVCPECGTPVTLIARIAQWMRRPTRWLPTVPVVRPA